MAKIKICLDAGHYAKYNRSPAVPAYYESEMNWKLHLMLKVELEKYGIEVITTRKDQAKDLSLYSRGAAAKGCNLMLSIHSNAVGNSGVNESVDHASAYCMTDDKGTKVDDISRELGKKLAAVVADVMELEDGYKTSTRLSDRDKNGDGVLNDNYYGVLNGARQVGVPGIILEHSFHTNTRSTKWLMVDSNLEKLAVAEAKVIAEYFGVAGDNAPASGAGTSTQDKPATAVKTVSVDLPTVRRGTMNSGYVLTVQAKLKALGYDLGDTGFEGLDGDFGGNTEKAVATFQRDVGITADGIVGKNTWAAITKAIK